MPVVILHIAVIFLIPLSESNTPNYLPDHILTSIYSHRIYRIHQVIVFIYILGILTMAFELQKACMMHV